MSDCSPPCSHPRLVHDMFGCKICKSNCAISIVYLTDILIVKAKDSAEDKEHMELAKALDAELDRKDETRIKLMLQRAAQEMELLQGS